MSQIRQEQWQAIQRGREASIVGFRERAKSLGYDKWLHHGGYLIDEYMSSCTVRADDHRRNLQSTLEKYEKMEKLSLLELAVLKAARNSRDELDTTSLYDLGVTCGLQVIVPLVKTFLGDSQW